MGNNEDDEPNPGCVHLRIHFEGGVSLPILNVDPDQYSYFDLVDDIKGLATDAGYTDEVCGYKRSVIEGPGGRSNTIRCGNCREFGHNILGCQRDKTKKQKKVKVRRKKSSSGANANMQEATVESRDGAASQDHSRYSQVAREIGH
ncbi:hypothetical protein P8452_20562 [Trifolium repens]|nr:hypothetical protein P8452_20562 [Trifolium repens]